MMRKHFTRIIATILASFVVATPQLCALQSVGEANPNAAALARTYAANLTYLADAMEKLEQDQTNHREEILYLETEIKTVQDKHFEKGVSSESFAEIVRALQTQRVQLMIDLAGLEARQQALQDYSAAKNDNPLFLEVVSKMQEQVNLLKEASDAARLLYNKGSMTLLEVQERQRSLLAAEIELLQMRLSNSSSPDESNDELRQIALERAEISARLAKSWEILQGLASVPNELRTLDRHKEQEQIAKQNLHELESTRNNVHAEYEATKRKLGELTGEQTDDN